MEVVHEWLGRRDHLGQAVIALGNFDGLGLGHQKVIRRAVSIASERGLPSGVVSFEPHPLRWLHPTLPAFSLLTEHQAERILDDLGVSRLYMLLFNADLSALTHDAFSREVLQQRLRACHVVVGDDFRYGRDRQGSVRTLVEEGRRHGFEVTVVASSTDETGSYSPARVRRAIAEADLPEVARILGRPFAIEGPVIQGARLGRTIGFPTANVPLGDYIRPRYGIYASLSRLPWGPPLPGVAYIGRRPTVGGIEEFLEVNLFDFRRDIYGKTLTTELVAFIREDQTFPDLESMKRQIELDCGRARAMLSAKAREPA